MEKMKKSKLPIINALLTSTVSLLLVYQFYGKQFVYDRWFEVSVDNTYILWDTVLIYAMLFLYIVSVISFIWLFIKKIKNKSLKSKWNMLATVLFIFNSLFFGMILFFVVAVLLGGFAL